MRVVEELVEQAGGGGVIGGMPAKVGRGPARPGGFAEQDVHQQALVAGPVAAVEKFVGEGLVKQPGHRAPIRSAGGLQQVVHGGGVTQLIEVFDADVVAEPGGEGEPHPVVQTSAPGIGQRGEQPSHPDPLPGSQPVDVLVERLTHARGNDTWVESGRSGVHRGISGQPVGGQRGDQIVAAGAVGDQ